MTMEDVLVRIFMFLLTSVGGESVKFILLGVKAVDVGRVESPSLVLVCPLHRASGLVSPPPKATLSHPSVSLRLPAPP